MNHAVPSPNIKLKRIYEPASKEDGVRILVDRLWPRGITKDEARLDQWNREVTPSGRLRAWFGHDPKRWPEFSQRYRAELGNHADALGELRRQAREGPITLLYAAKDEAHTHAIVLRNVLLGRAKSEGEAAMTDEIYPAVAHHPARTRRDLVRH
jgi:uncharacterized protein YeaO (DUF488 family)